MTGYVRTRKFIHADFQLGFIFLSLLMGGVSVLVHAVLVAWTLSKLTAKLPNDGRELYEMIPGSVLVSCGMAMVLVIPLGTIMFLLATFRWAGPLYRFKAFLERVAEGHHPDPCQLRDGDKLQDICDLLNIVTAPVRREQGRETEDVAA